MSDSEYNDAVDSFYQRLVYEFGLASGKAILQIFFEELGGLRINVPTIVMIERVLRDQRIINNFTGFNYRELSLRFGLSVRQIRRIVNKTYVL